MKIKKIFLIPYSTLDKLSNDTSVNSLRWLYRSDKIVWTKKNPFEYIVPPPLNWVGTSKSNIEFFKLYFLSEGNIILISIVIYGSERKNFFYRSRKFVKFWIANEGGKDSPILSQEVQTLRGWSTLSYFWLCVMAVVLSEIRCSACAIDTSVYNSR